MGFIVVVIFAVVVLGCVLLATLTNINWSEIGGGRAAKKELVATRKRLAIAEKGLRHISSGTSGVPALDAANTLEDIEKSRDKEIS